jgi:hypothetical protein
MSGHTIDDDVDMDGNSLMNVDEIVGGAGGSAGIKSADDDVDIQVGDNAGAKKMNVRDSDGIVVAAIDSNGNMSLDGNVDGVDISAHASNVSAHHTRYTNAEALAYIQFRPGPLQIAGIVPVDLDITAWNTLDSGICVTASPPYKYFFVNKSGVGIKYVELS